MIPMWSQLYEGGNITDGALISEVLDPCPSLRVIAGDDGTGWYRCTRFDQHGGVHVWELLTWEQG